MTIRTTSKMMRAVALVAVALMATAALAACGSDDGGGDGGDTVDTVKIGTLFPMTGDLAKTGAQSVNGAEMAVKEINAAGGIKALGGAKLELDVANTQGKPEVGMSEAERLIQQDEVPVVIGTSMSSLAIPISQKTERLKTPFIVTDAVANEITERGYKYTFRLMPKAEQFAEVVVRILQDGPTLNPEFPTVKRVATIHEDSDYGVGLAEDIVAWIEQSGMEHTVDVSYPYTATDLTTQVNKVKASDPDAVAVCSYLTDAIVIGQARERLEMLGIPFVDGGGGAQDPNFAKTLGASADRWFVTTGFLPSASDQAVELSTKFEQEYGTPMVENAMWGYQTVYLIAKVLENAGSVDREAVRQALTEVKLDRAAGDTVVIAGETIEFDDQGQNKEAALYGAQWIDGELKAVWPENLATDQMLPPQ